MLRLTRVKEEVHLHLFKKERRFSRNLIKGFGIALAFHFSFFFLFRVVSPKPPDNLSILLPSSVEIDLGLPIARNHAPPTAPFEMIQAPSLYEMAPGAICSIESYSEFSCSLPDFSEVEKFDYIPLEVDFDRD